MADKRYGLTIGQHELIKEILEKHGKMRNIIVGDTFIYATKGFINNHEAIGHAYCYMTEERINKLMENLVKGMKDEPPITGYLVFHEGGEITSGGFNNRYEELGFIMTHLTPAKVDLLMRSIYQEQPDEYKAVIFQTRKEEPKKEEIKSPKNVQK